MAFPVMMKNKTPNMAIRIWVPGCSTGEEAYSLAIALLEFLGERASNLQIQIFATDISEVIMQKARAGIYPGEHRDGYVGGSLAAFLPESRMAGTKSANPCAISAFSRNRISAKIRRSPSST